MANFITATYGGYPIKKRLNKTVKQVNTLIRAASDAFNAAISSAIGITTTAWASAVSRG